MYGELIDRIINDPYFCLLKYKKMKYLFITMLFLITSSCKEIHSDVEKEESDTTMQTKEETNSYPESLQKVFDAHGGLSTWKEKKTLSYDLPKPSGTETNTIDLTSRMDRIDIDSIAMGYDGGDVWIHDAEGQYKGDPGFYHNLMFYFYAMPFVLADDGIIYEESSPINFDGKAYPGIAVSYETGIGASPKDEYYLHYDSETNKMAWLGYTVTYKSGEKSDDVHWIRYDNWEDLDGVLLPKSLTWYVTEDGEIKEPRNTITFENITLETTPKPASFYAMPEGGKVVEQK